MPRFLSILLALAALGWEGSALAAGSTTTTRTLVFQAPFSGAGAIPTDLACSDGRPARAVLTCGVESDAWACRDVTGAAVAVTQGTGTTYEPSPFGTRRALVTKNATTGTYTAAGSHPLGNVWTGDHTIVAVARPNDSIVFTNKLGAGGGVYAWFTPTAFQVNYETSAAVYQTLGVARGTSDRWGIGAVRRVGNTITARYAGAQQSAALTAPPPVTTTAPVYYGSYDSNAYRAPDLAALVVYDCGLTDASLAAWEAAVTGARASDGRVVTDARASSATMVDGSTVGDNLLRVDSGGARVERGTTQQIPNNANIATYSLSASVTRTALADGWRIANGGAGYGGIIGSGAAGGLTGETWTATCEVKGTSAMRMHAGANETYCTLTSPGADWKRLSCTKTLSSNQPVGAYLYIEPGGTVDVRQCQLEKGSTPTSRFDCGATACTRMADVVTTSTAGWPVASGWYCVDFAPNWSTPPSTGVVLLDTRTGVPGNGMFFGINSTGFLRTYTATAGGQPGGEFGTSALTFTPGQTRRYCLAHRGNGTAVATVDGATVGTLTVPSPSAHRSIAVIGSSFGGDSFIDGSISRIVCGRL